MTAAAHLAHWADIEPLLDQVLALPATERERFLDTLPPSQQRWRGLLAELLRHEAQAARAGFLSLAASLPEFAASRADDIMMSAAAPQPGQVIGPWLLLEELGRGGMASVWLARRQEGDFQREVALKLPHSPSALWAGRFKRERDILARLSHPGIARLLDAGISPEGLPWLAMERVQGHEILAWCAQRQADVPQRVGMLLQIADALQYAHSQLVVHRDIKPGNVLVQADGQVRLLDFGIARLLASDGDADPALTQQGQRPMTPEYASPEQVRGEEPGIASDVYALGVLAYRLLSGASPYATAAPASRHALERAVLDTQPAAPSAAVTATPLRKALRGDLDAIVLKALAKQPDERYATIDAMAADLRRHLAGEPVLARPPSLRYRAGRFVARHRWAVGASALAVLALLGTTGWALVAADAARKEARRSGAMYEFLTGLFNPLREAQPDTRNRDMPVRRLIEDGAKQVLSSLKDEPAAREQLLVDLSTLTQQLGLPELSRQLADERVQDAKALHGTQSLAYADALMGERDLWESSGQYRAGYDAAQQALGIYQAHHETGPERLALAHLALGGFGARVHAPQQEDIDHLQQAAQLLSQVPRPNLLGVVYEQLTVAQIARGDMEAAYQASILGVQANRSQRGLEDWKTGASEDQSGQLAMLTLRPAEGEALIDHGLQVLRKAMGPDVVILARGESNLTMLALAAGRKDEARRHLTEAQRITALPANRAMAAFRLSVDSTAMDLAQRTGDWSGLHQDCAPWRADVQAPQPAQRLRLQQACAADAIHSGELARAQALLDQGEQVANQFFAKVPGRHAVLWLREGELAMAEGHREEAIALWQRVMRIDDMSIIPSQSQAFAHLRALGAVDEPSRARALSLTSRLQSAGGERYYAEYLALLRQVAAAQAAPIGPSS